MGPGVTSRYYKIDKADAFVQPGNWLSTGDVASMINRAGRLPPRLRLQKIGNGSFLLTAVAGGGSLSGTLSLLYKC